MNESNYSKSDIKLAELGRYSVPLIASDVGCYADNITKGVTGHLLKPDATPMDWARVLTKYIKNKKKIKEMGNNLKKITDEHYDLNKVVGDRLDIYEECFRVMNFDPRESRRFEEELASYGPDQK